MRCSQQCGPPQGSWEAWGAPMAEGQRSMFALILDRLQRGDVVSRQGRGGSLQLLLGSSLLGGKLFFIYCSLGKLCCC